MATGQEVHIVHIMQRSPAWYNSSFVKSRRYIASSERQGAQQLEHLHVSHEIGALRAWIEVCYEHHGINQREIPYVPTILLESDSVHLV
jgi:hypothetical protein